MEDNNTWVFLYIVLMMTLILISNHQAQCHDDLNSNSFKVSYDIKDEYICSFLTY